MTSRQVILDLRSKLESDFNIYLDIRDKFSYPAIIIEREKDTNTTMTSDGRVIDKTASITITCLVSTNNRKYEDYTLQLDDTYSMLRTKINDLIKTRPGYVLYYSDEDIYGEIMSDSTKCYGVTFTLNALIGE